MIAGGAFAFRRGLRSRAWLLRRMQQNNGANLQALHVGENFTVNAAQNVNGWTASLGSNLVNTTTRVLSRINGRVCAVVGPAGGTKSLVGADALVAKTYYAVVSGAALAVNFELLWYTQDTVDYPFSGASLAANQTWFPQVVNQHTRDGVLTEAIATTGMHVYKADHAGATRTGYYALASGPIQVWQAPTFAFMKLAAIPSAPVDAANRSIFNEYFNFRA